MSEYDVIVCGGGPAGSTTAFYAAKAGMKVLLLDKSKFPRDKACGGLLTARLFDELPELEKYIKPIIECPSRDVNLYSPSMKYQIDYEFPVGTPWNITREVFDNAVLEAARDVGAEVMTQTRIKDYEFNGGVTVKTSNGDFKGKMVIGATGPADKLASMIREKRNIKPWNDNQMGTALMWEPHVGKEFIDKTYSKNSSLLVHFKPGGIEGYGWVFPKKEILNIGFGGYNRTIKSIKIKEIWTDYINLLKEDGYFPKGQEVPPVKGAPLPLDGPIKATTMDYTLLVGDSAGMVSPLSGEGIYYGMHAGKIAVDTIKKALETNDFSQDHLDQYHRDWNKVFGKELRDLSFFALMALKLPERMVYYGTRDEKLCEIFADLFLGVTPGGLGKRKPITRAIFDAIRYPYFGLG
ncbi:geranylgeranyl reductase family protein [Marine Group III euryarchaeote]|nr:geranylgeranyl reductase family protein [Marine Group III euryarchaeote]